VQLAKETRIQGNSIGILNYNCYQTNWWIRNESRCNLL